MAIILPETSTLSKNDQLYTKNRAKLRISYDLENDTGTYGLSADGSDGIAEICILD